MSLSVTQSKIIDNVFILILLKIKCYHKEEVNKYVLIFADTPFVETRVRFDPTYLMV